MHAAVLTTARTAASRAPGGSMRCAAKGYHPRRGEGDNQRTSVSDDPTNYTIAAPWEARGLPHVEIEIRQGNGGRTMRGRRVGTANQTRPAGCRRAFREQNALTHPLSRESARTARNLACSSSAEVKLHLGRGESVHELCREGRSVRLFLSHAEGQRPSSNMVLLQRACRPRRHRGEPTP